MVALIRRDELDGFVEGLFGTAESLELPERAHHAINALSELRAIFDGLHELAGNPAKPVAAHEIGPPRDARPAAFHPRRRNTATRSRARHGAAAESRSLSQAIHGDEAGELRVRQDLEKLVSSGEIERRGS
jgi:hypothetical protein